MSLILLTLIVLIVLIVIYIFKSNYGIYEFFKDNLTQNLIDNHIETLFLDVTAKKDLSCLTNSKNRNYNLCCITDSKKSKFVESFNEYIKTYPQKIPKIIHQIWIGPNRIPYKWINTFKVDFISKHPEWKYYLWTEDKILNLNLKNKTAYLNDKSYHGKADIARYEILSRFGGIYIDADSIWLNEKDLGELIDKTNDSGFFIAQECKDCGDINYANGVIGCSKNNPIMRYVVRTIGQIDTKCNTWPATKTGPYLMDQVLRNLPITVFPYDYFYPEYWLGNKLTDLPQNEHKKYPNSYMYQFGYTTNKLKI